MHKNTHSNVFSGRSPKERAAVCAQGGGAAQAQGRLPKHDTLLSIDGVTEVCQVDKEARCFSGGENQVHMDQAEPQSEIGGEQSASVLRPDSWVPRGASLEGSSVPKQGMTRRWEPEGALSPRVGTLSPRARGPGKKGQLPEPKWQRCFKDHESGRDKFEYEGFDFL